MPIYTGNECPACGKVFAEGDDVVVCPVCGSPHHRECWKAVGHCCNEEFHGEGVKWEADPAIFHDEEPRETLACRQCGAPNPPGNIFCQACGHRMGAEPTGGPAGQRGGYSGQPGQQQGQSPFGGFMQMQPQLDYTQTLTDGVTVGEACDYVGPNNISFILKFKMLAGRGGFCFNWSAFFFSFFYCFYRKMYKMGAVLLAISLLAVIPTGYYSMVAIEDILAAGGALTFPISFIVDGPGYQGLLVVTGITRAISLACTLYCGLSFNKAYFANMLRNIRGVKENGKFSTGSQEYSYALYTAGGVNTSAVLFTAALIVVAYIAYGYLASFIILS